jgi:MoaA/NifB/PqqE/SkfB family radical SAM enzyme
MRDKVSERIGEKTLGNLHELVLELTDSCSQLCKHCSSMSGPHKENFLSRELALDIIHEAKSMGVKQINFGGGEPTTSPSFIDVLNSVISNRMAAEVYTSGVVRNGRGIGPLNYSLIKAALGSSPLKFIFAFHSAKAELHDYLADSQGSYLLLIESLKRCLAAGITCEINFVPLRLNASSFSDIINIAESFNLKRINVLRFVPQGRGYMNRPELELNGEEEAAFIRELMYLRTKSHIEIRTGSPFNRLIPGNNVPCKAGWAKLVVQATGNIIPCEVFKHHERSDWGLAVNNHSLRSALASSQMISLTNFLIKSGGYTCPIHHAAESFHNVEEHKWASQLTPSR